MLAANLFFGVVPIAVRLASREGIPSDQISFIRFAIACVGVIGIWVLGWERLATGNWNALIWRGICGGFAVLLYFYAIQMTTAGKGTLLNYTHSLWANLFLVVFFRQKAPKGFWWLLALAFVGLWLVLDPDLENGNWGDVLGLISGGFGAGAILSVKKLRQTDNALTIFASFSLTGLIFSLVPGLFPVAGASGVYSEWMMPSGYGWLVLMLCGVTAMAGQMFFTHGYAFTSVPLGTLLSLSVPALAAVGGWAFLGEPLTPHFLLGGTLIMIACGILGLQEGRNRGADAPVIER